MDICNVDNGFENAGPTDSPFFRIGPVAVEYNVKAGKVIAFLKRRKVPVTGLVRGMDSGVPQAQFTTYPGV